MESQLNAMRIRMPAPRPSVQGAPITSTSARPTIPVARKYLDEWSGLDVELDEAELTSDDKSENGNHLVITLLDHVRLEELGLADKLHPDSSQHDRSA